MELPDIGEFGLIERLRTRLPVADRRLVVGSGDDAAVWRAGPYAVATTDTLVAGVHLPAAGADWRSVGWKALAVNVSDIAAMGATPTFALVTFCVPVALEVAALDELADGVRECADAHGVTIAGGDVVSAPVFVVTVALYGEASPGEDGAVRVLRRDRARPGDAIAVTGALGGAGAGARLLTGSASGGGPSRRTETERRLIDRQMRPRPRVDAGAAALEAGAACAIDVSDGLLQDLGHIASASRVGTDVWLDRVPVDDAARAAFPDDATAFALGGGEDYELIVVAPAAVVQSIGDRLACPLAIIGRAVDAAGVVRLLDSDGREVDAASRGWDHLRRR